MQLPHVVATMLEGRKWSVGSVTEGLKTSAVDLVWRA